MDVYLHKCEPSDKEPKVIEVRPFHIEYGFTCDFCKQPLATPEQIIAHIYSELLGE